jgi:beta-1,4-mannosyltransferase
VEPRIIYIASFPTPANDTYYFWLYYEALAKLGYELVDTRGISLTEEWLRNNVDKVQIIHFHWPAYIYSKKEFAEFLTSITKFKAMLALARDLGYTIAWTVHNIFPHERNNLCLEYLARLYLARFSDLIFVHFEKARTMVGRYFFRFRNVHVIPHGNYQTVFPNNCSRSEARTQLGLEPDAFVYLIFGPVRPYKGVEEAIDAFETTATEKDRLLLVGNPSDEKISSWIQEKARANGKIVPHLRFVPKEEVQLFFNASDVVLLPYKRIFTSGNLFLALTFGKPVIAPDMGIISDVVDASFGIKYRPSSNGAALAGAMRDIRSLDHRQACSRALKRADSFTWEEAALRSDRAFRQWERKRLQS